MIATNDTKQVRCAIYTRKSTDENLDLDFNSLDAQREAAEAYIKSQQHEGWKCLPDRYDDGGFSGGNIDRPAFQRLMADVEAGKIDCILVYKIDRLSRSLLDFAKIMAMLDQHHVSLVSVTQQFNTTTSMGRLTLNILLSFAQFEREIISERTRDKMAAARRKGKWTGGPPVLGYDRVKDNRGSRLAVHPDEAERVRTIFRLYLDEGSIGATLAAIHRNGWKTKRFQTTSGTWRGGLVFDKSSLQKMLSNITYLGKVSFKGEIYDGEHEAIVDEELFGRVQGLLRRNRNSGGKHVRNKHGAMLKGLVRCRHCGCAMNGPSLEDTTVEEGGSDGIAGKAWELPTEDNYLVELFPGPPQKNVRVGVAKGFGMVVAIMHDTVDHDFAIEPLKPDQQWNWEEYWGWFTDLNAKARVS